MTSVVHLSSVHTPHDTRILYRECLSLAERGYEVSLLVCSDTCISVDGINVITFPLPKNRWERMTFTAYKLIMHAIRQKADIYHFHDPELAPWMLILRILGKQVIFDVHENIISSISDRNWIPVLLKPIISKAARYSFPLITRPFRIIFAERSYPNAYPWIKNYEVVCNFPKLDNFPKMKELKKYDTFSIIYVGSITKERGVIDILDSLKILSERGVVVDFYLVGKSHLSESNNIKKLIEERSLNNVQVLGYVPQPEALRLITRCHLGLAILHPVKNYISSYPTKLFEYMGCGVPFITSNFPLYQEIVDKWQCGFTIEPNSALALADKIENIISDRDSLTKQGLRGVSAVINEYNWCQQESNLFSLYEDALKKA